VRVIHRDVKSANVLLDEGCRGRIGDFGISKCLNDNHAGITATQMQTEHVLGTQVYMAPEYKNGNLSTKVDAFAFGLVVVETLTGYAVCSPAPGHRDLLSMFQDELDTCSKLLAHLDKRACWDQHKQERIGRLYDIADKCLELNRKKRPELLELIPELEEVRRGTEALPAEVLDTRECIVCFESGSNVEGWTVLLPCMHVCVCRECGLGLKECPKCRRPISDSLPVFL
jgi:serine/threonine protein kinase